MKKTSNSLLVPVSGKELREILSSYEKFYGLSDTAYEDLAGISERVFVSAGEQILTNGERTEWAYIVELGRLRGVVPVPNRTITVDLGRGE